MLRTNENEIQKRGQNIRNIDWTAQSKNSRECMGNGRKFGKIEGNTMNSAEKHMIFCPKTASF